MVDGSNIATEGRSLPSLKQLQEAVMSFMEEYPDVAVTVVVDATFGHRIDKEEAPEFEEGIANNELVAPPAGAVGRGDAFVLGIADKAGATVLSNDSFQEFHGNYEWLFDEGRLIGGKPVPHVGWVWVDRVPVRGPVSRKATAGKRSRGSSRGKSATKPRVGSKDASAPMPVPTSPPPAATTPATKSAARKPARKRAAKAAAAQQEQAPDSQETTESTSTGRAPKSGEPVNDLMPFLDFVEHHPVGSEVTAVVDAYSSHGAYVVIGESGVRGYVPLRLMADPTPRSARQVMKLGASVELVVVSFAAARRSIDCAVPALAEEAIAAAAADEVDDTPEVPVEKKAVAKKTTTKKTATKKTATKKTAAKKSATKKSATKKTAAKKSATKKTAAKKSATKKKGAAKTTAATAEAT